MNSPQSPPLALNTSSQHPGLLPQQFGKSSFMRVFLRDDKEEKPKNSECRCQAPPVESQAAEIMRAS